MRSEDFISPTTPHGIGVNFESDVEEYDYTQIGKGIVHAIIIPFLLAFANPILSTGYVLVASILYATLFRHKSSGFFGVLFFMIAITSLMIVA